MWEAPADRRRSTRHSVNPWHGPSPGPCPFPRETRTRVPGTQPPGDQPSAFLSDLSTGSGPVLVADPALVELARLGPGQLVPELDRPGTLVGGQVLPAV